MTGPFSRGHTSRRAGEIGVAALSATTAAFTQTNVAILIGGGLARDIATSRRRMACRRRGASVLDIHACMTQGLLPDRAQILLAASLGSVSPLALAGTVLYAWLLGAMSIGFMRWTYSATHGPPRRKPLAPKPGFRFWSNKGERGARMRQRH